MLPRSAEYAAILTPTNMPDLVQENNDNEPITTRRATTVKDDRTIEELVTIAARSISGADRGEYCTCKEPESLGMACGKCHRRIPADEVRAVVRIVGCHDHAPGPHLDGYMCKVCTGWPDSPRHHGVAAVGKTSWGAAVHPIRADAPNDDLGQWTYSMPPSGVETR